jgi:hypothetical protein
MMRNLTSLVSGLVLIVSLSACAPKPPPGPPPDLFVHKEFPGLMVSLRSAIPVELGMAKVTRKSGKSRTTIGLGFTGGWGNTYIARITWFDGDGQVISDPVGFIRRGSTPSDGILTLDWLGPVPQAAMANVTVVIGTGDALGVPPQGPAPRAGAAAWQSPDGPSPY